MCGTVRVPAQQASGEGVPAHLVVTVEPHKGATVPEINSNEVIVYEGYDRDKVLEWIPAQGDRAALQMFFLVDHALNQTVGTQLEDIRQFISHQPPTTLIGIAYMQNGIARVEQDLTGDREQVVKACNALHMVANTFNLDKDCHGVSLRSVLQMWMGEQAPTSKATTNIPRATERCIVQPSR